MYIPVYHIFTLAAAESQFFHSYHFHLASLSVMLLSEETNGQRVDWLCVPEAT